MYCKIVLTICVLISLIISIYQKIKRKKLECIFYLSLACFYLIFLIGFITYDFIATKLF